MEDAQVGEWTSVVGGDDGTETGDAQVGGWSCVVATTGNSVLGAEG